MADPLSILSTGASIIGNIVGSQRQQLNFDKQLKLQQEENRKNRQFNAEEADKSRSYNSRMVDEQRAYDSPAAQAQRMIDAGFHPALAFGQGLQPQDMGIGSTAMQAANSSSGVGSSLPSTSGIEGLGQTFAALASADHQRVLAQLKPKEFQIYESISKLQAVNIGADTSVKLAKSAESHEMKIYLSKQSALVDEQIEIAKQTFVKTMAEAQSIGEDVDRKKIENKFLQDTYDIRLSKAASEAGISYQYMLSAARLFASQIAKNCADASSSASLSQFYGTLRDKELRQLQAKWPELQARMFELQGDHLNMIMDWLPAERRTEILKAISQAAIGFLPFLL